MCLFVLFFCLNTNHFLHCPQITGSWWDDQWASVTCWDRNWPVSCRAVRVWWKLPSRPSFRHKTPRNHFVSIRRKLKNLFNTVNYLPATDRSHQNHINNKWNAFIQMNLDGVLWPSGWDQVFSGVKKRAVSECRVCCIGHTPSRKEKRNSVFLEANIVIQMIVLVAWRN